MTCPPAMLPPCPVPPQRSGPNGSPAGGVRRGPGLAAHGSSVGLPCPPRRVGGAVVIADAQPIFREGLRRILDRDGAWQVAGEAADGVAALELIRRQQPAAALLDAGLARLDGPGLAWEIRHERRATGVILLAGMRDEALFNAALDAGAGGYLLKDEPAETVLAALASVAAGGVFFSPALTPWLLRRAEQGRVWAARRPGLHALTASERRILRLVAEGRTTKEIAAVLHVAPKTVENHRLHIAAKLRVHGNNAVLRFALEHRDSL